MNLSPSIPGSDLIEKGLRNIAENQLTPESLLIHIASPALRFAGLTLPRLPQLPSDPELILYELLRKSHPKNPHSTYNSLLRRIDSFCKAYPKH